MSDNCLSSLGTQARQCPRVLELCLLTDPTLLLPHGTRLQHNFGTISGIGYEATIAFVSEGANVVMADVDEARGRQALERIERECRVAGGDRVLFVQCDVSSNESVASLIATGERHFGLVNVLFNNAGIMHGDDGDTGVTSDAIWNLTMDINAKGVFYCCRHGIPALKRAGGGSVINTASFVAKVGAAAAQIACKKRRVLSTLKVSTGTPPLT